MGEEFHAVIKLVTGEEIFSLVCVDENDGDPILLLMNPVIMKVMRNHVGQYVKVKPWMEIPSDQMYVICLLYTSPSPRDLSTSRMPSSA